MRLLEIAKTYRSADAKFAESGVELGASHGLVERYKTFRERLHDIPNEISRTVLFELLDLENTAAAKSYFGVETAREIPRTKSQLLASPRIYQRLFAATLYEVRKPNSWQKTFAQNFITDRELPTLATEDSRTYIYPPEYADALPKLIAPDETLNMEAVMRNVKKSRNWTKKHIARLNLEAADAAAVEERLAEVQRVEARFSVAALAKTYNASAQTIKYALRAAGLEPAWRSGGGGVYLDCSRILQRYFLRVRK